MTDVHHLHDCSLLEPNEAHCEDLGGVVEVQPVALLALKLVNVLGASEVTLVLNKSGLLCSDYQLKRITATFESSCEFSLSFLRNKV